MSRIDPAFVTWRQFGEIFWICTLTGVIVGTPIYLAHLFSGFRSGDGLGNPWMAVLLFALMTLVVAFAAAGLFALVGAVFASIVLLLMARHVAAPAPSPSTIGLGMVAGALAGALHPWVILVLIVGGVDASAPLDFGGLRLAAVVAMSGAFAGGLVVRRYC